MSNSTIHFDWITFLKNGLDIFFSDRADVFVAGDLLWYPVMGRSDICVGPDVFVAFGRPKGDRSCYKQWEEGGVAPGVVFEILSRGNTVVEMMDKQSFYGWHGVQEYVVYDPKENTLRVWVRDAHGALDPVKDAQGWHSPLMNLTFWTAPRGNLHVVLPDGSQMLSQSEIEAHRKEAEARRKEEEVRRKEAEVRFKEAEAGRKEEEARRKDAETRVGELAAKLKELGIDPDKV